MIRKHFATTSSHEGLMEEQTMKKKIERKKICKKTERVKY
jgi:hypothetical protein